MKRTLSGVAVALLLACAAGASFAQSYPNKPVRLLLTFAAGGQTDVLSRSIGEKMLPTFGQPLVIENRPGAGGNLAMEAVAKATPDGYLLVLGSPAVAINGTLYKNLSFDPLKDLVLISLAAYGAYAVYGSAAVPVNNMAEFVAYAKARPGKINFASTGVGTGTHLAAVMFGLATGIQMTHVPYKGIQQAAPDLVAGQVHLTFNALGPLDAFLQSGKLKLLATSGPRRLPKFPDLPTISESVPGFEAGGWYGFLVPANTPREIQQRLNSEIVAALRQPDLADRIEKLGLTATPQTLEEAARFLSAEGEKWSRAVKASGATAE